MIATIMHQHAIAVSDKVCMEILNLKVINLNRSFKYFVLYLFNDDVFTIERYKYISCTELASFNPALYRRVEGMLVGTDDLFTGCENVYKLGSFIDEGLNNRL